MEILCASQKFPTVDWVGSDVETGKKGECTDEALNGGGMSQSEPRPTKAQLVLDLGDRAIMPSAFPLRIGNQ